MTDRRFPVVATIVVALAVAAMIGLGFWQLQRLSWKEALIARYTKASISNAVADWPPPGESVDGALYHRATVHCLKVLEMTAVSGTSARGVDGWAHLARCKLAEGGEGRIEIGWANDPAPRAWGGGEVRGAVAPWRKHGALLIADPPQAGLEPLEKPDPRMMPNNHLAYAVQWFLFAATALVIYAVAVWKRMKGE